MATSPRTEAWLEALESGDLALDRKAVLAIAKAFVDRGLDDDVRDVVAELQRYPLGELGVDLRPMVAPKFLDHEESWPELLGADGISASSISVRDRLLILAPLTLLVAMVATAWRLLAWTNLRDAATGTNESVVNLVDQIALPAALIIVLTVAMSLTGLESAIARVTGRLRSKERRRQLDEATTALGRLDPPVADGASVWSTDAFEGHLIPRHRESAQRAGLVADLCERCEAMTWVAAVLATTLAVVGLALGGIGPLDGAGFLVTVAASMVAAAARRRADTAARTYSTAVVRGLGRRTSAGLTPIVVDPSARPAG